MAQTIIDRAAVRAPDGEVYSVPCPKRHGHINALLQEAGAPMPSVYKQGFLTSAGDFVDRKEALAIAEAAGQVPKGKHGALFTEHLW